MNGSGDWFREWFREWLGEWFGGGCFGEWFWDALGIGSRNGLVNGSGMVRASDRI